MRDTFPGWYQPDEREVEATWKSGLIVFDASAILNLYQYANDPRQEFFDVLESVRERLWLPHQAAMEFQRNRVKTIVNQVKMIGPLKTKISNAGSALLGSLEDQKLLNRMPIVDTRDVRSEISQSVSKILDSLNQCEEQTIKLLDEDTIRARIDGIFLERVGAQPQDQARLNTLHDDGKKRLGQRMPPGFSDEKKGDASYTCNGLHFYNKYGDYILWTQILEYVSSESIPSLIFVTDDEKEDWWQVADLPGRRAFAPHPELVREFRELSNGGTLLFLTSDSFLREARNRLALNISEATIGNVKENLSARVEGIDMRKVAVAFHNYLETCYLGYEVMSTFSFPELQIWESDQCVGYEMVRLENVNEDAVARKLESIYWKAEPFFKTGELYRLVVAVFVSREEECATVGAAYNNIRQKYGYLYSVECFKPEIDEDGEVLRVQQLAIYDNRL